ncbi:MAG TPA: hypothetical protein VFM02_02850 [Candidatus Paceibacterota bacterium]|nr:hypothetical protein [Candidatus Paceibacterota bacterium]
MQKTLQGKEEENHFFRLTLGFLGIIGIGLAAMLLASYLEVHRYHQELSSAVQGFQEVVTPSRNNNK